MRIYVAGPYSAKSENKHTIVQEVAHNVDRAIQVAVKLIERGHYPFVPHLCHYIHTNPACRIDYGGAFYYEYDNSFLDHWAEALFLVAPSPGANAELNRAEKLGLKIFYSIEEVPVDEEKAIAIEEVPVDEPDHTRRLQSEGDCNRGSSRR